MSDIESYGKEDSAGFKNIIAIRNYVVETRKEFQKLESENKNLRNMVLELQRKQQEQFLVINQLRAKLFNGSTA